MIRNQLCTLYSLNADASLSLPVLKVCRLPALEASKHHRPTRRTSVPRPLPKALICREIDNVDPSATCICIYIYIHTRIHIHTHIFGYICIYIKVIHVCIYIYRGMYHTYM